MDWDTIIKFFGGTAAVTGLFAFLGKKAIEAYLAGKLESHKNNLEKIATEHAIRFQHLHTERGEVIKTLYQLLVSLDESLHSSLRRFQSVGEPSLVDKVNKLGDDFNKFREFYLPNKIFFESSLCEKVESIVEAARGIFFDITTHPVDTSGINERYDPGVLSERHEFWESARTVYNNEISTLKTGLEDDFRLLLGINT